MLAVILHADVVGATALAHRDERAAHELMRATFQRLEQLAEPGGVSISAALREASPARLPLRYEPLGEQQVKGFDEPVRVFRAAVHDLGDVPAPAPRAAPASVRPRREHAA